MLSDGYQVYVLRIQQMANGNVANHIPKWVFTLVSAENTAPLRFSSLTALTTFLTQQTQGETRD